MKSAAQLNALVRAHQCSVCPTPCAFQTDSAAHLDGCASCPLAPPAWGQWDCAESQPPQENEDPRQMRGLGDVIALVANPIAKALRIDPKKCGCHGPNGRQARLNKAVPFR